MELGCRVQVDHRSERTDSFLRFRFEVPAKQTMEFVVSEKGDEHESISISTADVETFGVWQRNGWVDEPTHAALAEIAALVAEIGALGRQIESHEAGIKQIFENQGRLRENLKALGSGADEKRLRERYVSELAGEEDRIGALRKAIEELGQARKAKEAEVVSSDPCRRRCATRTARSPYEPYPHDAARCEAAEDRDTTESDPVAHA